jgi:Flp pilus assembly protein TadD
MLVPRALLGVPGAVQLKRSPSSQETLRQVQADILANRWDQAQAKLDALAPRLKGNGEFHFLNAALLFHREELTRALEEVDGAIGINPQEARYYLLRGQMYERIGDVSAAQRDYGKNIELAPAVPAGVLLLEKLLLQERRAEDALPVVEQAVKRLPKDPALHFELGRVQEILRRSPEALGSYARAVELDPKLAAAHVGLGRLYRVNPDTIAQSVEHLRQAVALQPRSALWHHELGLTYLRQGNLEEARVELEKAAELNPKDRNVFAALGTAYTRLKMPKEAAEAQRRSFALTQESGQETYRLAQLEADLTHAQELEFSGRSQEALDLYQQILKTSPEEPQVFFALARLHLSTHQSKIAAEYIRRALKLRPARAEYHQLYAMALVDLGRPDEAELELRTAILLRPTDSTSRNALGDLLMREGHVEAAIEAYQQAVQLAPEEPSCRLSLSRAYRRKGDLAAADRELDAYSSLLARRPSSHQ